VRRVAESGVLERFRLDGRVILVTGATGHLGRPIAHGIAAAGGTVVLAARSSEKLTELARKIDSGQRNCHVVAFDVSDPQQCMAAVDTIGKSAGRLDGIVNCANAATVATLETSRWDQFEAAYKQNAMGPFLILQSALQLLRESARTVPGGASVVNIASMYGHVSPDPRIYGDSGKNNPPFYGAAKAALLQLTRYLAVHLGPDRIRVNSVSPGPFPPPSIAQSDPVFHERLCAKTPLGRIGNAAEVVTPVLFLLSDAASFITGADLAVDGGWTAW
jgi:NAD(P)-dependent dehydrogenase (short-subunit alcohol dehydrogenase family)